MLRILREQPQILTEAKKARFKPSIGIQILLFIAVFIVISIVEGIPTVIINTLLSVEEVMSRGINPMDFEAVMAVSYEITGGTTYLQLIFTGIGTILAIVYCRFIEKRSLYSMGFNRKNAVKDYLVGLVVGFVMFGACVLISWLSGSLRYSGFTLGNGLGLLIVFFIGFIIQGMSEEVILRGYFMMSVAAKKSVLLAVILNSVFFAALHLMNPGVAPLAIVNLVLFGLFASVYTLKMNSIWGMCAIHSIWNFAQGNIFGIKVSGLDVQASILSFEPQGTSTLINGGSFGLEGGLAVTVVLILSTLIILRLPGKGIVEPSGESRDLADSADHDDMQHA